jgi:hypothetical protein
MSALLAPPYPSLRRAVLRRLRDRSGTMLEHALVLWLPGPSTYTGEDCAEPHLHGSRAAVDGVADALAAASLRPAEPWGVHPSLSTTPWRRKPRRSRDIDGGGWIAGDRGWGLTRGEPAPQRDRPAPLALLDDDLDFYDHDHQHHRQEVKMSWLHLFLQVEAGGEIPPASSFAR